jgi:hypothetical protein
LIIAIEYRLPSRFCTNWFWKVKKPIYTVADTKILLMNIFGIIKITEIKTTRFRTEIKKSMEAKECITLK